MTWSERVDWAQVFVVPGVLGCRVETATASASASAAAGGESGSPGRGCGSLQGESRGVYLLRVRGEACAAACSLVIDRRRLEEGLIACLPWQFEGGKHGVEGGDHDCGFFFVFFGRRGWGLGGMGLESLSPEVRRVDVWMEKLGMQFSFAVVKSSVKEYASIGS